jgi:hypothetical protein
MHLGIKFFSVFASCYFNPNRQYFLSSLKYVIHPNIVYQINPLYAFTTPRLWFRYWGTWNVRDNTNDNNLYVYFRTWSISRLHDVERLMNDEWWIVRSGFGKNESVLGTISVFSCKKCHKVQQTYIWARGDPFTIPDYEFWASPLHPPPHTCT